ALPAASRFAPENVYWISRGPGLTMSESHQVPSVPAVTNAWFTDRIERQGTSYLARVTNGTLTNAHIPFVAFPGPVLTGDSRPLPAETLTDCASGDWNGALTVRLVSLYEGEDGVDAHFVHLTINGSALGDIVWANEAYQEDTFPFASASVSNGTLALTLHNVTNLPSINSRDPTRFLCLSYAIDYARRYVARDDRLRCTGGSGSLAAITHFTTNDVLVLDVTDAARPLCVTGCEQLQDAATGLWSVSFACGDATRIYRLASNSKGFFQPAVRGVRDTDWGAPAQATPHVILIPPEAWRGGFRQAVEPLRAFRTSQGIPSRIVDVEALYNAFSDGLVDPEAIRAFCSAMRPNGLTYLLLAGAGAVDFKHHRLSVTDYSSCLIPTLIAGQRMAQTGEGEGIIVALDGALGDTDGDGRPDVAVGRLPTSQTQQVTTVVGKTIAYETRPPRTKRPVSLVADWENVYPKEYDFSNGIDRLQEPLRRAGRSVMKHVQVTVGSGTAVRETSLFPALRAGAGLFHFFGHSNEISLGGSNLSNDRLLYIANIKPGNWRIPPIGAVIGCRVNGWHRLTPTNLILPVGLFATDTGFAGCMGSTGYMRASEGENLAVALFTPGPGEETVTLGKVWLRGMRSMAGKTPQERLLCFSLIGDPALRFGVPPYPGTA
ncbi:MAG TPA: C25 family cysteine peptidase, partial [Kiritimatiellia bacterium]|nr:C25 family cysteine peptidase [Kiritimatiellia bacterium]